jgi:hypothetical protein
LDGLRDGRLGSSPLVARPAGRDDRRMLRLAVPTLLAFAVAVAITCSKAPELGPALPATATAVPGAAGLFAEPLASRSKADGPRFAKVDPARSGLRF